MLFVTLAGLFDTVMSSESSTLSATQLIMLTAAKLVVPTAFVLECLVKFIGYRFLGDKDPRVWPSPTTAWELVIATVHVLANLNFPYMTAMLPLRALRIFYMVKRLRLMMDAFLRSLTAVWTALLLMAGSFLAFGIAGMNMYSGLLWHCVQDMQLNRKECEDSGLSWENRPFHFDDIVESSITLFSVWSLQGWTEIWYWAMDVTFVDEAPEKDYAALSAFIFFASFIMWNSLMLTNLFTSMLCDFFARKCCTHLSNESILRAETTAGVVQQNRPGAF